MKIYLPEKVIFTEVSRAKLKSINVLYDFSNVK